MNYEDIWPLIQQDILGVLSADTRIGPRIGAAVEPGDQEAQLNAKITAAIGAGTDGKIGVGFLVLPIEQATDENASVPGGPLKLTITVQFVENVTLNRGPRGTRLPVRAYVARAEKLLKLYTPVGFTANLVPASPVIHEFTPDRDKNLRVGQVEFTATEADDVPLLRLNRPQLTVAGDVTQLSQIRYQINSGNPAVTVTQTSAAVIYYTTDGSHPYDKNPTAQEYTGPVEITGACLFRARAFGDPTDGTTTGSDTAALNFV